MSEEYTIPSWCEPVRRLAVEVKDASYQTLDGYFLAEKLRKLFKEHIEFQYWDAEVKQAKELKCKMCGNYCEILLDDITKERTCNICGKGKIEYAIKKLAESEGAQ